MYLHTLHDVDYGTIFHCRAHAELAIWPHLSHKVKELDCLLFQYMLTHGTKLAEIDFCVFLIIFGYTESNAERCQAQIFMQRLELFDSKLVPKIARKSLNNTDVSNVWANTRHMYAWFICYPPYKARQKYFLNVFNLFSGMLNL